MAFTWDYSLPAIRSLRRSRVLFGLQRRQSTDHRMMSCAKVLKKIQPMQEQRVESKHDLSLNNNDLYFAEAVGRQQNGWLPKRVMFGTLSGAGITRDEAGRSRPLLL